MLKGFFKNFISKHGEQKRSDQSEDALKKFIRIRNNGIKLLKSETTAEGLNKVEGKIRSQFSLYYRWSSDKRDIQKAATEELTAVQNVPGLAHVFMFHGDGRIREQAIHHLDGPFTTTANVYGLYWRLNDWAPQVRKASLAAVNRVIPSTSANIIVPALKAILPHVHSWGRWSAEGPEQIDLVLGRSDIATVFLEEITSSRQSGLGLIFRKLSKTSWIDPHIESVFRAALLPHVRTIALDMLLSGRARWPTGQTKRVWIDRSMNKYRTELVFAEREITIEVDPIALIAVGARDRSAMVRRRAADGLIALRHRSDLVDAISKLAANLRDDPNIGVRDRIEFLLRKGLASSPV